MVLRAPYHKRRSLTVNLHYINKKICFVETQNLFCFSVIIIVDGWRPDSVKLAEGSASVWHKLPRVVVSKYLVLLFAVHHWTPPPWRHSEGSHLFDVEKRAWWVSFCSILTEETARAYSTSVTDSSSFPRYLHALSDVSRYLEQLHGKVQSS